MQRSLSRRREDKQIPAGRLAKTAGVGFFATNRRQSALSTQQNRLLLPFFVVALLLTACGTTSKPVAIFHPTELQKTHEGRKYSIKTNSFVGLELKPYLEDEQVEIDFLIENQHTSSSAELTPETSVSISHWGMNEPVYAYTSEQYKELFESEKSSGFDRTATAGLGILGGLGLAIVGGVVGDMSVAQPASSLVTQGANSSATYDELDAIVDDKIFAKMSNYFPSRLVLGPKQSRHGMVSLGTYEDKDIDIEDHAPFFITITVHFTDGTSPDEHVFAFNQP